VQGEHLHSSRVPTAVRTVNWLVCAAHRPPQQDAHSGSRSTLSERRGLRNARLMHLPVYSHGRQLLRHMKQGQQWTLPATSFASMVNVAAAVSQVASFSRTYTPLTHEAGGAPEPPAGSLLTSGSPSHMSLCVTQQELQNGGVGSRSDDQQLLN
jgi:hypothetical protein